MNENIRVDGLIGGERERQEENENGKMNEGKKKRYATSNFL